MTFCHFSYLANQGPAPLRPHELRDGDAFVELSHALVHLGHEYGGLVINYPTEQKAPDLSMNSVRTLSKDDFIVMTTRPPLNDRPQSGNVRVVRRSHTKLERAIFDAIHRHLATCARDEIQLDNPEVLEGRFRNRADLRYYVKTDRKHPRFEASYNAKENDRRFEPFDPNVTTAGYLLHTESIMFADGRKGPRVLAVFGVSGTVSLALAYLLRKQARDPFIGLLDRSLARPGLMMIEITVPRPDPLPRPFRDLTFVEGWKYRMLTI